MIEADSLPLQKSLVAGSRLYTVLPLHAVWHEVQEGRLQAARIVSPPFQRTVSMATARSKGQPKAVAAVTQQIARICDDMARRGMWHAQDAAGSPA